MLIAARVRNDGASHEAWVGTAGVARPVALPPRGEGRGSAVSGGELLLLALATCYCNDLYREAGRRNVPLEAVEVEARAEFASEGVAASNITYRARVSSPASEADIADLLRLTDAVAEVQSTVRTGVAVARVPWERSDP